MPTEYFHIHRTVGFIIAFYKEEPSLNSILSQLKPLQTLAPYFYKIYFHIIYRYFVGRDNSVGIATGYGLDGRDRISVGARFSAPVQTGPGAHPASCTVVTRSFPGVKSGRGVTLTPHSLLVPWSWKGRAIPLLPLWTVRPVQSLSACTRVHFTLPLSILYSWYQVHRLKFRTPLYWTFLYYFSEHGSLTFRRLTSTIVDVPHR